MHSLPYETDNENQKEMWNSHHQKNIPYQIQVIEWFVNQQKKHTQLQIIIQNYSDFEVRIHNPMNPFAPLGYGMMK